MGSTFWIVIGVISVVAIITDARVKMAKASRSGTGFNERVCDLEEELHDLKTELSESRQRIEVLERIVTDEKIDLGRQIDDLASSN